jgi:hypothetical protein
LHGIFSSGGGEIDQAHLPVFQSAWRLWYSVLKVLFAVLDGAVAGSVIPRVEGSLLTPSRAREMMRRFFADADHGTLFDPIIHWSGRMQAEFSLTW